MSSECTNHPPSQNSMRSSFNTTVDAESFTMRHVGTISLSDPGHPGNVDIEGAVYTAKWRNKSVDPAVSVPKGAKENITGTAYPKNNNEPSINPRAHPFAPPPPPNKPDSDILFKDCGGLENQINFLKTAILEPLRWKNSSQNQFKRFGLEPPKGVLFHGPPGTGKTRLAQALGNELNQVLGGRVHFIYRKGQDIASMYFGQSSVNLRMIFEEAKAMQPCVLFFDELDGLCPNRDGLFVSQSNITIVTTMLGLLDDLPNGKVFVIAATNRIEAVDGALRRPGRFDKYLEFLPPHEKSRYDILTIHTSKWKVLPSRDLLVQLSQQTTGFSGADLCKLSMDAFDVALTRTLYRSRTDSDVRDFARVNFDDLNVTKTDWMAALKKMKPSNSAIFGSALFVPSAGLGSDAQLLFDDDVEKTVNLLTQQFPVKSQQQKGAIHSFYVFTEKESLLIDITDNIITSAFKSEQLRNYPVYSLSPEILYCEMIANWSTKVHNAFSQAINAAPAILYLQNVDHMWNIFTNYQAFGFTLNLKNELERLRGTSVLLVASGSTKLSNFAAQNPFKEVLFDKSYKVIPPNDEQRFDFFQHLFSGIILEDVNWTRADILGLCDAHDSAVEITRDKQHGSIIQLYDLITLNRNGADDKGASAEIVKTLMHILGSYKIMIRKMNNKSA